MTDDGEALQGAYRYSQGFLEVGASGTGSDQPFWDAAAWGAAGTARIDLDLLKEKFQSLDWANSQFTDDHELLVKLLSVFNFLRVMKQLKPTTGCGFGEGVVVSPDPSGNSFVLAQAQFMPHGGEQIIVDMPDLSQLAKERDRETRTPTPKQVRVEDASGLLDGLTPADLKVLKSVADGLRRARQGK